MKMNLMSFLKVSKTTNVFKILSRCSSRPANCNCHVEMDREGIAVATMKKVPVNSLNLEFLGDLISIISSLENDKNVKGLIITSGMPGIFTAGLDILEMYKAKRERASQFWSSVQNFWLKLYSTPLVTMAAINGHSPAGGCLVAVSCDYRVMASGNYTIGLNETQLGLVAPFWVVDTVKNTIGHMETERMVQMGCLYSSEEAQRVRLVDMVVKEEEVMNTAKNEMKKWLEIPNKARIASKLMMRQKTMDKLLKQKQEDIERFLNFVMMDSTQKHLEVYMEKLKKRKC